MQGYSRSRDELPHNCRASLTRSSRLTAGPGPTQEPVERDDACVAGVWPGAGGGGAGTGTRLRAAVPPGRASGAGYACVRRAALRAAAARAAQSARQPASEAELGACAAAAAAMAAEDEDIGER